MPITPAQMSSLLQQHSWGIRPHPRGGWLVESYAPRSTTPSRMGGGIPQPTPEEAVEAALAHMQAGEATAQARAGEALIQAQESADYYLRLRMEPFGDEDGKPAKRRVWDVVLADGTETAIKGKVSYRQALVEADEDRKRRQAVRVTQPAGGAKP